MTTIHDLRRAIEQWHEHKCFAWDDGDEHCNCYRNEVLTTLDAAEKHLREMVNDMHTAINHEAQNVRNNVEVAIACRRQFTVLAGRLAAFLNADEKGGDAE